MIDQNSQEGFSALTDLPVVENQTARGESEKNSGTGAGGSISALNKGRFSHNLLANLISFALAIGIGLAFTPYLIHHLGIAAYGLVPLTVTLTSYLGLITMALNAVVGRYLTIEMEKGDMRSANVIFNTSLFGVSALALVIVLIGVMGSIFIDSLIKIPHGYEAQARLLLLFCVGSFLLIQLATPFLVSSFCCNRLDIQSTINSANLILRVIVVVLIFNFAAPRMWQVGVGYMVAAAFTLVCSVLNWRMLTPQLSIALRDFSVKALRQLTSTGFWVVISQLGTMLLLSVDLLIVNRLFGPDDGGRYGAILQWSILLRGIAGTVSGVFAPTMMYFYAHNDNDGLVRYAKRSVRLLGILIGLPVGLVCGFSRPLLTIWLDPSYAPLATLLVVMTVHLSLNLAYLPLHSITQATNQVRVPGIVQIIAGFINLGS
ncbi:MAG: polysaccharide biosynthesis protein [Armatimonadetes bacterium]|nr:polysaccharide biosynthesis protein [Armatimonadota bacterium]